jgi:hypothetical protein
MPSTSKKQHKFMEAVAHNPSFAKKAGVPQSVGAEFSAADKGKKFGKGGTTRADVQRVNEKKTNHGDMSLFNKGGQIMAKSSGNGITKAAMGKVRTAAPSRDGVAEKGKTKGKQVSMKGMKPLGMCGGGMSKKK